MIFRHTAFNDFANNFICAGTPVSLNHFSGGLLVCHAGFAFNCHLDDLPVKIGNFPQQLNYQRVNGMMIITYLMAH